MFEMMADGAQMQSNPFVILTFIAAPAILTNAAALMVLSTTNRFAASVERARELSRQIVKAREDGDTSDRDRLDRELLASESRAIMLLRAIRSFYFSLGFFAFAASVALLGAGLVNVRLGSLYLIFAVVAVVSVFLGVVGLVMGSVLLFMETRTTVRVLQERIKQLQQQKI